LPRLKKENSMTPADAILFVGAAIAAAPCDSVKLGVEIGSLEASADAGEARLPIVAFNAEQSFPMRWQIGLRYDPLVIEPLGLEPPPGVQLHPFHEFAAIPAEGRVTIDHSVESFAGATYEPDAEHRSVLAILVVRVLTAPASTTIEVTPRFRELHEPFGEGVSKIYYCDRWVLAEAPPGAGDESLLRLGRGLLDVGEEHDAFVRGDVDQSGDVGLEDALLFILHYFLGDGIVGCADAADVNDDGNPNITDLLYLFRHVFLHGPAPPPPFFRAGQDPTPDRSGCTVYP